MNGNAPPPTTNDRNTPPGFRGSGGTDGGVGLFFSGLALASVSTWLFFDSVRVSTDGHGLISGLLIRNGVGGGAFQTTSMGLIFVPFFSGVFALFYDARPRWAWWLTGIGVAIVALEILSRIQFIMAMKTSHLLLVIATFAAGTALMLRSYRELPGDNLPPDSGTKQP